MKHSNVHHLIIYAAPGVEVSELIEEGLICISADSESFDEKETYTW